MPAVICPSCNASVADGTVLCPKCDAVLDASAFEDPAPGGEPGAEAEVAPAPPPRRLADPRAAAKPVAAAPAPAAPPDVIGGIRRRRKNKVEVDYSPDRVLGDAWEAIQSLMPFDRLSVFAATGTGLSLILPWRFTQVTGEEIGMFGGGWPVLISLAVAGAAIWIRTSNDLRGLRADQLAAAQIASAVVTLAFSVWYFFGAIDNHPYKTLLGTTHLKTSSPEMGVVVCAMAAITLGVGSIWAWMVERGSAIR